MSKQADTFEALYAALFPALERDLRQWAEGREHYPTSYADIAEYVNDVAGNLVEWADDQPARYDFDPEADDHRDSDPEWQAGAEVQGILDEMARLIPDRDERIRARR